MMTKHMSQHPERRAAGDASDQDSKYSFHSQVGHISKLGEFPFDSCYLLGSHIGWRPRSAEFSELDIPAERSACLSDHFQVDRLFSLNASDTFRDAGQMDRCQQQRLQSDRPDEHHCVCSKHNEKCA